MAISGRAVAPRRPGVQFSVAYPVRLLRVLAPALLHVFDVLRVVALEPDDFAVALEGEDVRRDAV
jgi:hypothetical protein